MDSDGGNGRHGKWRPFLLQRWAITCGPAAWGRVVSNCRLGTNQPLLRLRRSYDCLGLLGDRHLLDRGQMAGDTAAAIVGLTGCLAWAATPAGSWSGG
jgi:hypothetical protein